MPMPQPQYLNANGQQLAVYHWEGEQTPQPKEVVLLVHGYPDSAAVWHPLAQQLKDEFSVYAYDVRGAGLSSKPKGKYHFQLSQLRDDLFAVIDSVSPHQPVHLVAYDWGAPQAWEALFTPEQQHRIASLSTAAPAMDHAGQWFHQHVKSLSPRAWYKASKRLVGSSYMMFFQLPWLPEAVWKYYLAQRWARHLARLEGKSIEVANTLKSDAVHSLGLYRANLLPALLRPRQRHTKVPVQLLIMQQDPFITPELFEGVEETASTVERQYIQAGHWWALSAVNTVAPFIRHFIQQHAFQEISK